VAHAKIVKPTYNHFMDEIARRFRIPDLLFFSAVVLLTSLGLVMVYSSSSVSALERYQDSLFYLKRQLAFLGAGMVVMFFAMACDYRKIVKMGGWILAISAISLALVFVPGLGHSAGGAQRWIGGLGVNLQPSEFAKVACIIYLTWALVRKGENTKSFTYGLLPMLLVAATLSGMLILQPDFGNAVVLFLIAGVMIFLAGARLSYLLGIVLWSLPVLWVLITGSAYRKRRLLSFLDPWSDPQNASYQILQSFTAFYSGGFWGTGLGNSHEKLYYLPEVHTDFIGAVLGEELGFIGVLLVVLAFIVVMVRGYRIAVRAEDPQGFLLAAGCTSLIGIQAILNFMVILGLLPTKGLPLPFFSHGGNSLLASLLACGLIMAVGRKARLEGKAPRYSWLKKWGSREVVV